VPTDVRLQPVWMICDFRFDSVGVGAGCSCSAISNVLCPSHTPDEQCKNVQQAFSQALFPIKSKH